MPVGTLPECFTMHKYGFQPRGLFSRNYKFEFSGELNVIGYFTCKLIIVSRECTLPREWSVVLFVFYSALIAYLTPTTTILVIES